MGIGQIKEKIGGIFRSSPKIAVYLSVAAACVLLLLFMKTPKPESAPEPESAVIMPAKDRAEELEDELEEIITKIRGVGKVSVMVTVSGTEEKEYISDISERDGASETKTVIAGSKEALLKAEKYPEVRGVLVVCSGGDKPQIQEKVVNAVSTVLDIPTNKVFVTNAE